MTEQKKIPINVFHISGGRQDENPRSAADGANAFSGELFRSAFEQSAMGMAIGTPNGKWLKVNKRFCEIVGYDSAELLIRNFEDITHPDDVEADHRFLRDLYLLKIPSYSREKRYAHKNGTYLWVNVTVSLAPNEKGEPYHLSIIEDVTRRRLAENALRQSERSLRSAHRVALLGTWDWNIRQDIFTWSAETYLIFGRTPPNLDACLRQVHPDDREFVKDSVDAALRGSPFSIEFRIVTQGAIERVVHMQGELAFDVYRRPLKMAGTLQDITDNKLEDRLRESRERLESISSNIPGMVFQLQQTGEAVEFTYVSDGSNEVCGLTSNDIAANPSAFLGLLHRAEREAFHESRIRSANTLSLWNWEGRLEVAGQWVKWVNLRATPRNVGVRGTIWDGVIFNISQSKEHEAEIEQSREMLRALSAHQMVVKEEEGRRIAREIHDELGQRLTVLRMDVMMLPKALGAPSAPLTEAAGRMRETIDGILRIVRDISSHLRPAALDIGFVLAVEWLVENFQSSAGIPCNFNNRLDEGMVLDDERATGVFRILQESLTNVARHANAGHIEVTLEIVEGHLHLHVKDDGAGFESGRGNSKKTFGVRGMRERAVTLGGEIMILSSLGAGTAVFASIPLLNE
ncbi:PAS domain S-box protein [Noviherbaspirillum cavernae]|uniref:PAS domain S-box protein n=1 Tax=Noviherbaspirillum cavernae TaxID=2320862 RepID=A0A418WVV1_9BURK|nr:sensor histidine kinase [Noviherbaspirillum cavernae]RJF96719.1 PAS domain S-box protein [Noviherbaspirillum cavernae]